MVFGLASILKTGPTITLGDANWGTDSLSHRECDFMIWAYDESQGKNGNQTNIGIHKCEIGKLGEIMIFCE